MTTKRSRVKRQAELDAKKDEEEENEETKFYAKILAPVVWSNFPAGFEIRDIKKNEFDDAIQLLKDFYIPNELLCNNIDLLEDETSVQDLLDYQRRFLFQKCSICAIDEELKKLIGVAILRVMYKQGLGKVYSRVRITEGETYKKIRRVHNFLNRKTDLFEIFDCDSYLQCNLICVHNDYRRKGIGLQMLRCSKDVCKILRVPCFMGIFSTHKLQAKAKKLGMEVIKEIYYVDWSENADTVFWAPGAGNYTLNVMACEIEIEEEPKEKKNVFQIRTKAISAFALARNKSKKSKVALNKSKAEICKSKVKL